MAKSFKGAEEYRRIKQVGDRLSVIMVGLRKLDPHQQYKETIDKFNQHLAIVKNCEDEGNLPWLSRDGFSRGPDKLSCLYAIISQTILLYWGIQKGREIDHLELETNFLFLGELIEMGLKHAFVIGHYPDFELSLPE